MASHQTPPPAGPVRDQIGLMADKTVHMLKLVRDGFARFDVKPLDTVAALGREVRELDRAILAALVDEAGSPGAASIFIPVHLERIGDNVEGLATATRGIVDEHILFTDRAVREISNLFRLAIDLVESVRDALITSNRALIAHVLDEGSAIEQLADEHALSHQKRLVEGVCVPRASSTFVGMLDDLKGIEWHAREVAGRLLSGDRSPDEPERRHARS